ncbi:hypothetical protein K4G58_05865 [Helicobacter sp. Faydin-H64]|uniref:Uncharacterized protein n=2 Tax=Helicobacter turcicus TaxID=2867412 RepID=A0ABS7JNT6_9HELI|nr:hypothetical protein [Helicobacter turcicus]MBX7545848.1 hypothetical protein [Helicobacter turcicus]
MRKVVGGAYLSGRIPKDYGIVSNFGQNIYYTAYYEVELDARDSPYFNLGSNYYAAVATTYDFRTNRITTEVVKINNNNSSDVKTINFQNNVISKIKNFNQVRDWIKSDKSNIKYFR